MIKPLDLSIVIPVYNSRDCLPNLVRQINSVLAQMSCSYEIIMVNDSSRDNSWNVIQQLASNDTHIRGFSLRKNFGQDSALMAGLNNMRGRYAVIMDDDLQHDPSFIPALLDEIEKGYDVVYGKYTQKKQAIWKNVGSWINGKAATALLKKPNHVYLSPYKIIASSVVKEICKYEGAYPYIDGLLFRVTDRFSQVNIEHHKRFAGKGNFTLIKSVLLFSNLATNFSVLPLRLATFCGLFTSACGIILALAMFMYRILNPGWPARLQ